MSGDKPQMNGTDPLENGINGTEDVEMDDNTSNPRSKAKSGKDKDGDEEMTVVVPPPKASKISGVSQKDNETDITMNGSTEIDTDVTADPVIDLKAKAIAGK